MAETARYIEVRRCWGTEEHREIKPGEMHVYLYDEVPMMVDFLCPCGCGSTCPTHLVRDGVETERHWRFRRDAGGVTLTPSIRYLSGCRAHFNITNGEAVFHADSGKGYTSEPPLTVEGGPISLRRLGAELYKYLGDGHSQQVATLAEADGIMFQCPKCSIGLQCGSQGSRYFVVGAHHVMCWFRGRVPDSAVPNPGRWTPSGTGIDDLTFVPGEPKMAVSVLLTGGCGWHGHIVDGKASLT
jgi:hypothetical protein